jgi:hypothetical protein
VPEDVLQQQQQQQELAVVGMSLLAEVAAGLLVPW